jgi:hypothetical protein
MRTIYVGMDVSKGYADQYIMNEAGSVLHIGQFDDTFEGHQAVEDILVRWYVRSEQFPTKCSVGYLLIHYKISLLREKPCSPPETMISSRRVALSWQGYVRGSIMWQKTTHNNQAERLFLYGEILRSICHFIINHCVEVHQ